MSAGVLIVGAGLAGQRCAETLRARGYDGPVTMVGAEPFAPYDRPPLSKAALAADTAHAAVALRAAGWHAVHRVDLVTASRAIGLDARARVVRFADGTRRTARDVVLATGSRPRTLPALDPYENVHTLRTLADARALGTALAPGARLVVVGGGFLGLEVAATARSRDVDVALVEAGPAPAAGAVGARMGAWLAALHLRAGVAVRVGATVARVDGRDGRVRAICLSTGERLACDAVLVAVGTVPDTAWAGFPAGVAVATSGATGRPGLWAAGDAALPWDAVARRHVRTEHWEAAARQGAAVAQAILGRPAAAPAPAFWTDQFGIRMQLAGTAAGHDALVVDGDLDGADARVLFLRGGRPIGGLLVGRPRALPDLRRLLAGGARSEELAA